MPFNGEGVDFDSDVNTGQIISGTLTDKFMQTQSAFTWLNHTWSHQDLYTVTYQTAYQEIYSNTLTAQRLGFTDYTTATLLTGAYSGLTNTNVISAAYDLGVRYMESNASMPGFGNPSPNTGILTGTGRAMLLVPRLANNVFYFADSPAAEVDYYNLVNDLNSGPYCPAYYNDPTYNPANLCFTYPQIVDRVTNQGLGFLLDFNVDATMFHMNNLNAYNAPTSTNTLMADYVAALYAKYNTYYNSNVPILSLRTQETGSLMQQRMDYNASGVTGIIGCANQMTVTVPAAAPTGARVPVTGVSYGSDTETYAGQPISYLQMAPGDVLGIPGTASPSTPSAVTGLTVTTGMITDTLTWDPVAGALGYRVYSGTTPGFALDSGHQLGVATTTTFLDSSGSTNYAVTAIADDCWKHESSPAYVPPAPTSYAIYLPLAMRLAP